MQEGAQQCSFFIAEAAQQVKPTRIKSLDLNVSLPADPPEGAYIMTVEATDEQDNTAEESVTIALPSPNRKVSS